MTLGVFQHESAAGGDGDGEDGEHEGGGATFAGEFHSVVSPFTISDTTVTGMLCILGSNPGAQPGPDSHNQSQNTLLL